MAVYEATEAWKDANPGLEFYVATTLQEADFSIQWIKEFGGEHVGQAFGRGFIEVGLGDSSCGEKWQPYSSNYVTDILMHEIGHFLGNEHSSDTKSIMYSIALNHEFGLVEQEFTLTENYIQFIPFCTIKDVTSYNFQVESDEPTYGFDVYVVPSVDEFNQIVDGKSFKHYSGNGCFAKNSLSFRSTCDGVPLGSGILVIIPEKQTNPLTKITVKQEEIPSTSGILQKTASTSKTQTQPDNEISPIQPRESPIITPKQEKPEYCNFSKDASGRSFGTMEIQNGWK
ncbi:MAG: matrixin family metalloprotease, partial [Bacteroidetes bacterium]|nr:matrixin family metalloprotease [Bacteroidota bacterium]